MNRVKMIFNNIKQVVKKIRDRKWIKRETNNDKHNEVGTTQEMRLYCMLLGLMPIDSWMVIYPLPLTCT